MKAPAKAAGTAFFGQIKFMSFTQGGVIESEIPWAALVTLPSTTVGLYLLQR